MWIWRQSNLSIWSAAVTPDTKSSDRVSPIGNIWPPVIVTATKSWAILCLCHWPCSKGPMRWYSELNSDLDHCLVSEIVSWKLVQSTMTHKWLTNSGTNCCGDDILLVVDEFYQFLLLFQGIRLGCFSIFGLFLSFEILEFLCVFGFLGDEILKNCFFVKQIAIFPVTIRETNVNGYANCQINSQNSRHHRITTWLQCQRTTIETFHRIFANATSICSVTRFGCIAFFLIICVHGSGRTIPCVTCHFSMNAKRNKIFDKMKTMYVWLCVVCTSIYFLFFQNRNCHLWWASCQTVFTHSRNQLQACWTHVYVDGVCCRFFNRGTLNSALRRLIVFVPAFAPKHK